MATEGRRSDRRALGLGAVAWAGAWWVESGTPWFWAAVGAVVLVCSVRRLGGWNLAACALAALGACGAGALHLAQVDHGPLPGLAREGAAMTAELRIGTTPVRSKGRFAQDEYADATVRALTARGRSYRLRSPVLVLLPLDGPDLRRGDVVRVEATPEPSDRPERAAVLRVHGRAVVISGPGPITRGADTLRAAIARAAGHGGPGAALVPGLVDGDDAGVSDALTADFRTTGLTHLTAVSGTNLTLILGFLLLLARWCGVRARGLLVTGGLGVVGFVVLAGPQPSVLRAAAMGTVALIGMGAGGREAGIRALGAGTFVLLLIDPGLAVSPGFVLSALATAGILLLAPRWRDALGRWLPRPVAEAIAVPLAAQLACTPLIAALSGQVSLVALAANLAAAPLVAPATVLGLVGGLVALVCDPVGRVVARPAVWCAEGIVEIARRGAGLELPAITWSTSAVSLLVLVVLCAAMALAMPHLLARPVPALLAAALLTVVVLVPLPTPGWPPPGWVFVACSVGQGDGLVLAVGVHAAVVVDAGPDPRLMDRCLRRLHVRTIPVLVLTHFHADHVDGIGGVLHGRRVGVIETSPLADPPGGAAMVARAAAAAHVPVRVVSLGEVTHVGAISWQVLGPPVVPVAGSDSPPNDASVVMLVQVSGIRILLMGDEERPSQALLHAGNPDLHVDVLKVAHHGSSKQDPDLVGSLGARVAVISVGVNNDYGHPAGSTLDLLRRDGMQVRRTDQDGDVAVVVDGRGRLSTVSR
ncbi:MAG: ComEC/Rec2 family competence protein [Marmoricola sp.]